MRGTRDRFAAREESPRFLGAFRLRTLKRSDTNVKRISRLFSKLWRASNFQTHTAIWILSSAPIYFYVTNNAPSHPQWKYPLCQLKIPLYFVNTGLFCEQDASSR